MAGSAKKDIEGDEVTDPLKINETNAKYLA